ncbi:MAG TPA: nuclear transport factor 2 family protein [Terriglobales bacterium]
MSEVAIQALTPKEVVPAVIMQLNEGQIEDAIASFADEFRFKDHGIGLEFRDKKCLAEFFQKTREFYPDSSIHIGAIFVSGDHVIAEWTLQTKVAEPFYAGQTRKHAISLQGASILRRRTGRLPTGRITTMD